MKHPNVVAHQNMLQGASSTSVVSQAPFTRLMKNPLPHPTSRHLGDGHIGERGLLFRSRSAGQRACRQVNGQRLRVVPTRRLACGLTGRQRAIAVLASIERDGTQLC